MNSPLPLAVYIHWPYCARICPYCDFNVVRDRGRTDQQRRLADAIIADLRRQAAIVPHRRISSVFFGGGTPSLMEPDWAGEILDEARRLWPCEGPLEVTLEANPTDAEAGRFAAFAAAGVNRLSLGIQSLNDEALKFLGRNHSAAEAVRAAQTAAAVFPRLSIDMIYARPGQTSAGWREELTQALALGPEHISPYQLTIEPGAAFSRAVQRKAWTPPDDERAAELYETTQAVLEAAGFDAYEVSNHARGLAARSVHNLAYWRGWDYVGAGPGAHGRLTTPAGRLALEAEKGIETYIAAVSETGIGARTPELLSPREAAIERLLLGLRSVEGVPLTDVAALDLAAAPLSQFVDEGWLSLEDGRLAASAKGRSVLDHLTAKLIP